MKQPSSKTFPTKETGLYFGSFNPVHIGHLAIANYMVEFAGLDEFWFVVTPQNPHKQKANLLNDYDRLEMMQLAVEGDFRLQVSDIEFYLPKPSYTVDTLIYLKDRNPNRDFKILMGSDNLENFHKWKNFETIVENYGIIVYPRPGFDKTKVQQHKNIVIAENAPQMEISSSFIRKAIKKGKDVRHFLPPKVWEYIVKKGLYR
ncbi:nicotinate (nicotinamide) nucleotide adenylyltransferase [Mariniphaga sp.]|uniref:nicotinate (nicotinamide) nucleotide adenylyltransferase n=1 Tax=Mariniphaga sp. TaxID=1954475 RepID=UPI0035636875